MKNLDWLSEKILLKTLDWFIFVLTITLVFQFFSFRWPFQN